MLNTKHRLPRFDSLEGRVLLSADMAEPAAAKHHETFKPFVLTGSLSGLPNGSPGVAGYTATSFPVAGHLGSMGTVHGSFDLADPFIPIGKLPDLAGASLTLENSKGMVQLAIAQTKKSDYKFTIETGTGKYTSTSGSGTMEISSIHEAIDLVIGLHSVTVKKA